MLKRIPHYFTIISLVILSNCLIWLPFIFHISNLFGITIQHSGFDYIYRQYDGLLYVVVAKTLYDPKAIAQLGIELPVTAAYFAAHLPLYPLLIRFFALCIGYLKSMIVVNLFATISLAIVFHYILKQFKITMNPLLLVTVFLFLPRFLVIRSVGSPEALFMCLILLSIFFFEKQRYVLAGLLGALSVMTKSPGILLFLAYGLVLIETFYKTKKIEWKAWGIGIIPLGLLAVFLIYWKQYGDFFAYFHSGDNLHLVYPYAVFNFQKPWVGTAWLEDIIFYFFLYLITVISLKDSKYRSFFYFPLVFFIATIFVQHRDISRYSLPLWPFACIAFASFFTSKKFLIAFLILLPAIILYAWNFSVFNVMNVADWKAFL